jgi:hypothetical protein
MTTNPNLSITELVGQLDKAIIAYDEADSRAIVASHVKDQPAHDAYDAEMRRLWKFERELRRQICATRARNRDEAILQAIVAAYLIVLVAEGTEAKRKTAARAEEALLSAIAVLIEPTGLAIGPIVRSRYFDISVRNAATWQGPRGAK